MIGSKTRHRRVCAGLVSGLALAGLLTSGCGTGATSSTSDRSPTDTSSSTRSSTTLTTRASTTSSSTTLREPTTTGLPTDLTTAQVCALTSSQTIVSTLDVSVDNSYQVNPGGFAPTCQWSLTDPALGGNTLIGQPINIQVAVGSLGQYDDNTNCEPSQDQSIDTTDASLAPHPGCIVYDTFGRATNPAGSNLNAFEVFGDVGGYILVVDVNLALLTPAKAVAFWHSVASRMP